MAKIWGNQIIAGRKTYSQVPAGLKNAVRSYLIEKGHEELVTE